MDGASGNKAALQSSQASPANGAWLGVVGPTGSTPTINLLYADILFTETGINASAISSLTVTLSNVTISAGNCVSTQCAGIQSGGSLAGRDYGRDDNRFHVRHQYGGWH